jgi:hypothetical protein
MAVIIDHVPMRDGVSKLRDFPKVFGGSGEILPHCS